MHRRTSRSSEEESVKCQGWEGRRETESIVWLGREGFKSCSNSTQSFLAGVNWNPVSKGNGCDSGWLQSNMPLNLLKKNLAHVISNNNLIISLRVTLVVSAIALALRCRCTCFRCCVSNNEWMKWWEVMLQWKQQVNAGNWIKKYLLLVKLQQWAFLYLFYA